MKTSNVFIAIASVAYAHTVSVNTRNGQSIPTTSGPVQGHIASSANDVVEYLGIPYAKPPVGNLRFAPPQAFSGSALINGSSFGYTCPATTGFTSSTKLAGTEDLMVAAPASEIVVSILGQVDVKYGEDCLTLNIWNNPRNGDRKKAVLFWIYGGGFKTGTTNDKAYNGKYIAEKEDVIVVSANYRVNIFGFPGNPSTRNNLGLLDQRLALEWVRDNIEAFGGDPNRITIFGQSAGGSSVDYYSFAWTSDPIVAGFIAESGSVYSIGSQAKASTSASAWFNVTSTLGCGDANSNHESVLKCIQSKEWESILNAIPSGTGISSSTGNFGPTVDELVVFSDYPARAAAGKLIKKPLFIGNNNNEIGLFRLLFAQQNITYSDAEWDFLQLVIYTCPASTRALISVANHIPTWRYRWFGNFPDLKLTVVPDSGAWHGSEVPVIFGTDLDIQNTVKRTSAELKLASYTRGAWAAFARDPQNGLTKYGLPPYNPLGKTLLQLAYNNETGSNIAYPLEYDSGCAAALLTAEALVASGGLI